MVPLKSLSGLTALQAISVSNPGPLNAVLDHLSSASRRNLTFLTTASADCIIDPASALQIAKLHSLHTLWIQCPQSALETICCSPFVSRSIRNLFLRNSKFSSLQPLKYCTSLRGIDISGCKSLGELELRHLRDLPHLVRLYIARFTGSLISRAARSLC